MTMTTATLDVPGATLYYETRGGGPVLLLIPGGNGDAGPFTAVGEALADRYTVVAYERRGFSRSPLDRPLRPGDDHDVAADADDAHRLLAHLTGEPAYVFGSSSGAVVALELMTRHADQVRLLLPHEPPAVTLLPDADELLGRLDGVYGTYRTSGETAAMAEFMEAVFGATGPGGLGGRPGDPAPGQVPPGAAEMAGRIQANLAFWLEHELRTYPRHPVDIGALRAVAGRIAPVCGRESRAQFPYRAATALAERIGAAATELPGGHVGYLTDADAFAAELAGVLARGCAGMSVPPGRLDGLTARTRRST